VFRKISFGVYDAQSINPLLNNSKNIELYNYRNKMGFSKQSLFSSSQNSECKFVLNSTYLFGSDHHLRLLLRLD